jgi:FkbM family methyltransferase
MTYEKAIAAFPEVFVFPDKFGYAAIAIAIETQLHELLKIDRADVKNICVVGAYDGEEIAYFLANYPEVRIIAFEANPNHFSKLRPHHRLIVHNKAAGDEEKVVQFHELNIPGSGSVLEYIGNLSGSSMRIDHSFAIQQVRLDSYCEELDLLWVDAQGYELRVLRGANLAKIKSLFLEVNLGTSENKYKYAYQGEVYLKELQDYLQDFRLVSLGLDFDTNNGTGNSFWLRKDL